MAIGLTNKRMLTNATFHTGCEKDKRGASRRLLLAALAGALVLTGCISAPKDKSSKLAIDSPGAWKSDAAKGNFEPQNWTKDFNDPQLIKIVEEALEHNYNLKAAASRLDSQIAGSRFAGSSIWPSLTGSGIGSRNKRSSASGIQQTPTSETFGLNARFNWELDIWGKVRNGYKGDLADIQSSQADYAAARLSIAGRVAQSWYSAIEAKQQFDLAERTQEALESSAVIVEENFKRGIARALDVRLVRANVASNRSTLETRLRNRDSSVRLLEVLLGRYPGNELKVATELPQISGPVPAGLPSELLLRRPDVVSAERDLAATEQRKFETSKARIPSLNLSLSRGTSSRELEDIFDIMDRRVWNQSLNIAQTIFQGGRLKSSFKRAKANYETSLANYSSTVLTAFREVENALNNQSSYERDHDLQKIAAEESAAAEQLAWEEYGRGLSTITTALDAVRRNITAQRALIQVSNQRVQSRIDLYLALGGGFDFEPTAEN
ncbi:MAG: efflux transporter outer membrane subunit [Verrucomicrobiia bacterium]